MKYLLLLGRILFSLIFLLTIMSHFSSGAIAYAKSQGVPLANVLVPFSSIMACAGALSIILGYKPRWGALLIILFLVPVTFMMHAFWRLTDEMQMQMQMAMFMKNISMMGAALIIMYFGTGPLSLDRLQ
jgi:putative oxidoreductase